VRIRIAVVAAAVIAGLSAPPALAQDEHAAHAAQSAQSAAPAARNANLPPDNDAAKDQLAKSPRHGEWVDIKMASGAPINSYVIYPERSSKAPVVIVVHDIGGMSDWIRGIGDQLAKEGFIAVVPDLLSGKGPNGGGTSSLGDRDQVGQAIRTLTPDELKSRLDTIMAYGKTLPSSNGKTGTIGFCWGGGTVFGYALNQPSVDATASYYGPMPTEPSAYEKAKTPILGLYGGNDQRVNANIPVAEAELKKRGVTYTPNIFEGAGHGFLRNQSGQDGANYKAVQQAWPKTLEFFRRYLDTGATKSQ
jgi:carboxymethylenebutenolidase